MFDIHHTGTDQRQKAKLHRCGITTGFAIRAPAIFALTSEP
jgi:hypothetical protein